MVLDMPADGRDAALIAEPALLRLAGAEFDQLGVIPDAVEDAVVVPRELLADERLPD